MVLRPPRSTLTDTLFPYTTLFRSVMHHVPDEMVKAFVACVSVDQVLEQLEPFWSVVNSLCPMSPYRHLSMEKLTFYGAGLHRLEIGRASCRERVCQYV